MEEKIEHARRLIEAAIREYPRIAIACSLGYEPCSDPRGEFERDCRWKGASKCGGECGTHTQRLK